MTISEIIEALEKTEGSNRTLDEQIARTVHWSPTGGYWPESGAPSYWFSDAFGMPKYTGSTDDAIALTRQVLPGWTIANIGQDDRKLWHAELREGFTTSFSTVELAGASTPALALCLATFKALRPTTAEESKGAE